MLSREQRIEHVRLCLVDGVGPILRRALLARFGEPQNVWKATRDELRTVPGIGEKTLRAILSSKSNAEAELVVAACESRTTEILVEGTEAYPQRLAEIPDAPGVLFIQGKLESRDGLAVAIVGTRHATRYGLKQAELLASGLARMGITVVSGLARGIDIAAHRAALSSGGRTIAVLGTAVSEVYPPEHVADADAIRQQGAVVSEVMPSGPPVKGAFPRRNRIISGLSLGVIVVEAAQRSGALISARHALEQNREVFALPGPVDSHNSRGCHQLLRDGAVLVESVDDVIRELGPLGTPVKTPDSAPIHHPAAELRLNDLEKQVLAAVGDQPTHVDEVIRRSELEAQRVLSVLSILEVRRIVRKVSGNLVTRV